MNRQGQFAKIRGSICNVLICKVFPKLANCNELILVRFKRHLKHRGYLIFETVRPTVVYEAFRFLKDHNKLHCDVLVNEELSSDEMIRFLGEE